MANATASRIDSDLDSQSPAADLVRVYLNGIGKTALLNAADEVELAKRIEAGLYAQHLLATKKRPKAVEMLFAPLSPESMPIACAASLPGCEPAHAERHDGSVA